MKLNQSKIYFKNKSTFDSMKNDIDNKSIVFVEEDGTIWTHGHQFGGTSAEVMTKEEYYDITDPIKITADVDSSHKEYTASDVLFRIYYRLGRSQLSITPDTITVLVDGVRVQEPGTTLSDILVRSLGSHRADIQLSYNGVVYTATITFYLILPTRIGFDASSSANEVNPTSMRKDVVQTMNEKQIIITNNEDGAYLWIITPATYVKVTTGIEGAKFPVEMSSAQQVSGSSYNYFRSAQSINAFTGTYFITLR